MRGKPHNWKHGLTDTPEHRTWLRMIARCDDPKNNRFHRYGGRGIKVCQRWRESFSNFLDDMGKRPSAKHSIDRIHNDDDYEPGNCCWSTPRQQLRNFSLNRYLTAFGETKTVAEWSEDPRCAVSRATLYARLDRKGWSPEQALTLRRNGIRHEHGRKPRRKKTA